MVEGSTPPAAEVIVELGSEAFALPTKVGRVLLERLADGLPSCDQTLSSHNSIVGSQTSRGSRSEPPSIWHAT